MKLLRQIFNLLSVRERLLLAALSWSLLLLWAMFLLRNFRSEWNNFAFSKVQLTDQNKNLELLPLVEERLRRATATLDPSRTYSASDLSDQIEPLLREIGFNYDLSTPTTRASDIFSTHTIRLRVKNGDIAGLMKFNQEIQRESPYIVLTQFKISADKRDPRNLDATFQISSFELKEDISQ